MENYTDYMEMARDVRKELETQRDIYITKVGDMDGYLQMLDAAEKACRETGKLKAEIETLQQQLAEERRQRTEMETRMNEMGKLSAGMARCCGSRPKWGVRAVSSASGSSRSKGSLGGGGWKENVIAVCCIA